MGLEVLQGDTDLTFIYRAFPSILAPGRDVGAQVYGDVRGGVVSYAVAILNGVRTAPVLMWIQTMGRTWWPVFLSSLLGTVRKDY